MSGFIVMTASDGREALKCLRSEQVSAVVTDVLMPNQDGIEVIRDIRAAFPSLPVIVVSGGPAVYLKAARALGADAAIEKPFDTATLAQTIHQLLKKKET
jgi:CheY-like chemotaxis protein